MKRLRRIIFNGLTDILLLLWVATVILWVRSYSTPTKYFVLPVNRWTGNLCSVNSEDGRLGFHRESSADSSGPTRTLFERTCPGFAYGVYQTGSEVVRTLDLSYWLLTATLMLLPALCVLQRVRRGHLPEYDLCASCGYDLRATPDRCSPESDAETLASSVSFSFVISTMMNFILQDNTVAAANRDGPKFQFAHGRVEFQA